MSEANGWMAPSAGQLQAVLRRTRTVAVLGASPNPARPSNVAAAYLLAHTDWDVYFVNPNATEILGRPVYRSPAELPVVPDLVDVFRRPAELPHVLTETIKAGASTLWLQFGLYDAAIAEQAEAAGLTVVMDRCLKIEHTRFAMADTPRTADSPGGIPRSLGRR
jgi:hypothetical protein